MTRVVATLALASLLGTSPTGSLSLSKTPNFPNLGQVVTAYARMEHPLPDRVCVEYILHELGDRTPEERGYVLGPWPIPIYRLSCRRPEGRIETFRLDRLVDGRYTLNGWTERNNVIESRPLPREMVIR